MIPDHQGTRIWLLEAVSLQWCTWRHTLLGIVLSFGKRINVFNLTPKSVVQLKAISIKYNWIWVWCYSTFSWLFDLWYSIEPNKLSFNWMQILLSQIFLTIPCNCAASSPWINQNLLTRLVCTKCGRYYVALSIDICLWHWCAQHPKIPIFYLTTQTPSSENDTTFLLKTIFLDTLYLVDWQHIKLGL